MKRSKKITVTFLLTLGTLCLIAAAYAPFNHHISRRERLSEAAACFLLGFPLTAAGGGIAWSCSQKARKKERDRLLSIFYKLLKKSNGRINLLQFAMEAQLTGQAAKLYLNEQAKEFNADFEVGDRGDVLYCFNMGQSSHRQLLESEVLSEPDSHKIKRKKH